MGHRSSNKIFCLIILCFPYCSVVHAAPSRQDITAVRQQKEALGLEQKRLVAEADAIGKMIEELSQLSEENNERLSSHQTEILRTLPLLARLARSNPFRMVVDPTTSKEKVRGIILMRFLVSSIKRKMQQVQANLNDIKVKTNDLSIKHQSTQQLLQAIERQKIELSSLESKKIEDWTKAEIERLSKEEDPTTLLEESRATLSKTTRSSSLITAQRGLPFRRLEQPVVGKYFKDAALQNKFSPHSQGLFFKTEKNAEVRAPARGKIVFKGPFRTQAEILIIDHGGMAHTILMGMDKIDAEVGKNVYAGEKLGTMAGYGAESPKLYLELRHKGKSIDASPYFGS